MTHKNFTHKDAMRQELPLAPPPPPDMIARVRNIICSHSDDAPEASMFLDMLGVPAR